MICHNCSSSLATSQGKFCLFCGAENTQQPNTVAHQPMQQPAFQPHFQQLEKKSTPAWVIILIVGVIVSFLALCCAGSVLLINSLDDDLFNREIVASSNSIPTHEEVVEHLEDRHGVNLRISWISDGVPDRMKVSPLNQAEMDFDFAVRLTDRDGEFLPLSEIEDGFYLALAGQKAETSIRLFAEDIFGQGTIDRVAVFYLLGGRDYLPQSIRWNPDDGMGSLRQSIADELSAGFDAFVVVVLNDSQEVDEILWEQVEELAEKITTADFYGIFNSLSVEARWGADDKLLEWRVQDGEMSSLERVDW